MMESVDDVLSGKLFQPSKVQKKPHVHEMILPSRE